MNNKKKKKKKKIVAGCTGSHLARVKEFTDGLVVITGVSVT